MKKTTLFICFLVIYPTSIWGQNQYQSAFWTRLYPQFSPNKQWEYHWEMDERRTFENTVHQQFITHFAARRKLGKHWAVAPVATYSTVTGVSEYRLSQELHGQFALGKHWAFNQRFRIEERWFEQKDAPGFRFRFRTRYRVQLAYSPVKWGVLKASEEYMFHTDAFDQNRVYVAVEGRLSPKLSIESGYLRIRQRRSSTVFLDSDIWRTTVLLRL